MANRTPEYSNANDWFGSLPKEKQDFLRDSKWAMVNSAFEAGRDQLAAVTAQRDELLELLCLFFRSYVDSTQVTIDNETFERAERILSNCAKCEVQNG